MYLRSMCDVYLIKQYVPVEKAFVPAVVGKAVVVVVVVVAGVVVVDVVVGTVVGTINSANN